MKTTLFAIGIGLLLTVVATPADAAPELPTVYCSQVYSETNVGPVTVVRRNSCAAPEVFVNEGFSNPELPTIYCSQVYSETNVGPVTVVRRNSCAAPEIYVSEEFSRPEMPLPVYCAQVYTERTVGPVTVIQNSPCSVPRVELNDDFDATTMGSSPVDPGCTWSLDKMVIAGYVFPVPAKCRALDGF